MSEAPPTQDVDTFAEAVVKIAYQISEAGGARRGGHFLSLGDVSALRRMDPAVPGGPFWRLMDAFVPEDLRAGEEAERRWAMVCRGMAVMAPRVHEGYTRPGRALHETGYSSEERPIRLNRLLRAEGKSFEDLFLLACRFLSTHAQGVDWRSFARLALRQDDQSRRALARDFYSTKSR